MSFEKQKTFLIRKVETDARATSYSRAKLIKIQGLKIKKKERRKEDKNFRSFHRNIFFKVLKNVFSSVDLNIL